MPSPKTSVALALLTGSALLTVAPATVSAQIAWDTPRMIGPESPAGFGVYWVRSSVLGPELDGAMATFGLPGTGGAISVRGGAAENEDGELSVFGGLDLRTAVARHTDDQPLDLEWTGGIGAGAPTHSARVATITVPTVLSVGRSWSSGSVWLAPYASIGVAFDLHVGADSPEDEFEWSPTADVGLDMALDAARRFVIRVGASLGDRHALAVGLGVS